MNSNARARRCVSLGMLRRIIRAAVVDDEDLSGAAEPRLERG
jgi:hypothetical protein